MSILHITAPATSTTSTIHIQDGALADIASIIGVEQYSSTFVITDDGVAPHYLQAVLDILPADSRSLTLHAGEQHKTIEAVQQIWAGLHAAGCDRKSLVINLGGGVVGDVGGFAASTYMRGIAYVNIPTTLLAQVDASVGGKNGCNNAGIKNLIGTFTQPTHIIIDPNVLVTLPKREFIAGFGEIIKHGLIADAAHIQQATAKPPGEFSATELSNIIATSCSIKQAIVKGDITEQGERKKVNFGHTAGHALESLSLATDKPLLHGEAVSIGMMAEIYIAQAQGLLGDRAAGDIKNILEITGLPTSYEGLSTEMIMNKMKSDKKNTNGELNFTLLKGIGEAVINQTAPIPVIIAALQRIGATT